MVWFCLSIHLSIHPSIVHARTQKVLFRIISFLATRYIGTYLRMQLKKTTSELIKYEQNDLIFHLTDQHMLPSQTTLVFILQDFLRIFVNIKVEYTIVSAPSVHPGQFAADTILLYAFCYYIIQWILISPISKKMEEI